MSHDDEYEGGIPTGSLCRHAGAGRESRLRGDRRLNRTSRGIGSSLPRPGPPPTPTKTSREDQTATVKHRRSNTLPSWARMGSNHRPRDYESPALTTELRARGFAGVSADVRHESATIVVTRHIDPWSGRPSRVRSVPDLGQKLQRILVRAEAREQGRAGPRDQPVPAGCGRERTGSMVDVSAQEVRRDGRSLLADTAVARIEQDVDRAEACAGGAPDHVVHGAKRLPAPGLMHSIAHAQETGVDDPHRAVLRARRIKHTGDEQDAITTVRSTQRRGAACRRSDRDRLGDADSCALEIDRFGRRDRCRGPDADRATRPRLFRQLRLGATCSLPDNEATARRPAARVMLCCVRGTVQPGHPAAQRLRSRARAV